MNRVSGFSTAMVIVDVYFTLALIYLNNNDIFQSAYTAAHGAKQTHIIEKKIYIYIYIYIASLSLGC